MACTSGTRLADNCAGSKLATATRVAAIEAAAPEIAGQISWEETALPFPAKVEMRALEDAIGPLSRPSLVDGIAETVTLFRRS